METTVGQLLVNEILPDDLRDYNRELNKKTVHALLTEVAEKYPDKFPEINKKLHEISAEIATIYGREASVNLEAFRTPKATRQLQEAAQKEVAKILKSDLPREKKKELIVQVVSEKLEPMTAATFEEAIKNKNPLAVQVASGSRGNQVQFRALVGGDGIVTDYRDNPIPIPIFRSYSQGVTPAEFYAGAFSTRRGEAYKKFCLSGDTLVRMGDGSLKPISEVVPGDVVWSFDASQVVFKTTVTHKLAQGVQLCNRYTFYDKNTKGKIFVTATENHKVLTVSGDGDCAKYELLPLVDFSKTTRAVALNGDNFNLIACEVLGPLDTYDLTVDNPQHVFILANGLVVSNSTPKAGYLGKQLAMAAHRTVVTEHDCGTKNGILVNASDAENVGAVLAGDYDDFTSGTVLTPKVVKALGDKKILVRSTLTCQSKQGVCQKCAGIRERGSFPPINDNIGIAAAQALSEPMAQAQMNVRHGAQQTVGSQKRPDLDTLNQLFQVPKSFQGAAAVADLDGVVEQITKAPQGGTLIRINGTDHYVPPGLNPMVKIGDNIEAGEVLSEGIPNPAAIVKHRGIGEGRLIFTNLISKMMKEAGFAADRRNIEIVARNLVNHVRITDLDGPPDTVPEDVVEYDSIVRDYQPRYGFKVTPVNAAKGFYLEKPVLHYSIGTRITPKVIQTLKDNGVENVPVHPEPPPFEPEMTRAMENLAHSDDWIVRMAGLYGVRRSVMQAAHVGSTAERHGVSYVAPLAEGIEFGKSKDKVGY